MRQHGLGPACAFLTKHQQGSYAARLYNSTQEDHDKLHVWLEVMHAPCALVWFQERRSAAQGAAAAAARDRAGL